MSFLSTHTDVKATGTQVHTLLHRRLFLVKVCMFLIAFACAGVPLSAVFMAHAQDTVRSTNVQAFNKALKQKIHVTHTGSQAQMHASVQPTYNNVGISDNTNPTAANFDQHGNSYSEQDFQEPGGPEWNPGDTLTYEGINYIWPAVPAGQSDNYVANGQVIPVTPVAGATTIGFVGAADNATPSSSGKATLTYTDGTTQTFTLGMTDWLMDNGKAIPLASNRYFAALPHTNSQQGTITQSTFLFEMETHVKASKTLQSVTLPKTVNQGRLHIFMIATRAGDNYPYNVGTSPDNGTVFANYDGANHSYSTQALKSNNIFVGQPFSINGVNFTWADSFGVIPDNYQAAGQTLLVTPVANATTLAFLGSATDGSSSGTATITYTDGSKQNFKLGFADWITKSITSLPFGNSIAATMPYRNSLTGQQTITTYVFYTSVTLQTGKTVQSVTLPTKVTQGALHVFSVALK